VIVIVDDPLPDEPPTEEQRQKTLAWFDRCFNEPVDNAVFIIYPPLRCRDTKDSP
jgi:hypothetical protein